MSHRNSKPKPSASERTRFRWRVRHEYETPLDTKRLGIADFIRTKIHEIRHPNPEVVVN